MRRRSLRLELVATLAIVLMMAVVSLSLVGEALGQRRHRERVEEQVRDHARGLSSLVAPLLGAGERPTPKLEELERVLRPSLGSFGIVAIEIHRFGGDTPQAILELGVAPELPAARRSSDPQGIVHEIGDGLVVLDRPLRTFAEADERSTIMLRLVARASGSTAAGEWREILILALGVGGVLFVLGVLLLEVQVVRPLARVREAVGEVERGNLDAAVPAEGPHELHEFAEAFNRMTDALRTRVQENEAQRQRLVRSEQLASVGRIAAGVAHEVGNPLAALLGYVDLLLDPRSHSEPNDEQRQLLERSRTQLLRIQTIVGQLLEYARPPKTATGDIVLGPTITRLLTLLRHDPRCTGVELDIEGDHQLVARVDPAILDQILQNLVVNGCRAARNHADHPRVWISLEADAKGHARISVCDNGAGVPEHVRPQLFEPFFTTARPGEGTGLGLAISQGLALQMDGTLEHLPQDAPCAEILPGPGAVFVLTLPRANAQTTGHSNATGDATV